MKLAPVGVSLAAVAVATFGGMMLAGPGLTAFAAGSATPVAVRVDNFQLVDQFRFAHELKYYKYAPAIVLMMQDNGSASSVASAQALQKLRDAYAKKGVVFFLVNSTLGVTREQAAAELARIGVDMKVLIDEHQLVGEQLGASKAGEVFVIDTKTWKVAYHGPVDDRFTSMKPKAKAKKQHLSAALDAMLAGKPVAQPEVDLVATPIAFPERSRKAEHAKISYSEDVAPILLEKCVTCHQPGGIGPFPMKNYQMVKGFAPMIRETIRTDRMPPYFADARIGHFKNDQGMTAEQTRTLVHWIEAGAPRGDGPDLLAEKVTQAPEWPLGQPDHIVEIPAFDVPATGLVDYQNQYVDNPFKEDKWLRAIAVKPGERAVLHHMISGHIKDPNVKSSLPGGSVGSYTPGAEVQVIAENAGAPIPAGGKFRFQMHYTTTGKPATDRTKVGFYFNKEKPKYVKRSYVIGDFGLSIPAGAQAYTEVAYATFPHDAILYTLYPHAHLRGKHVELTAIYPDGKTEILLSLPEYDFNWQRDYDFVEPLRIPGGTKLVAKWTYDNSKHNVSNPDPTINVTWGEQTHEEMMYFRINYRWVDETSENIRQDYETQLQSGLFMGALDDNVSGGVEPAEMKGPLEELRPRFAEFDKDGNGRLDAKEVMATGGFLRNFARLRAQTPDL